MLHFTGRDRAVSYKDRLEMPYTEAVLLETQRKGNVAATLLPHCIDRDMFVDGVVSLLSTLLYNSFAFSLLNRCERTQVFYNDYRDICSKTIM